MLKSLHFTILLSSIASFPLWGCGGGDSNSPQNGPTDAGAVGGASAGGVTSTAGATQRASGGIRASGGSSAMGGVTAVVTTSTTVAGSSSAGGASALPFAQTLSQYRTCQRDGDCPAALGDCITEIPFDKPDAVGQRSITVAKLFPSLGAPGICTHVCTTERDVCSKLTLRDSNAKSAPFSCQLVAQGASAYVPPTSSSGQTLASAPLTAGDAYGAICMPPFGLDPAWPDSFCQPCTDKCDGGLCWDVGLDQAPKAGTQGVCIASCSATNGCPAGFACQTLTAGQYCVPTLGTCTDCRDADHDGRGLGHCTTAGTTPVDCNDKVAAAYYDQQNPDHAFPNSCGALDYNCNGVYDSVEIIARPQDYGTLHCGSCDAACAVPATGNVLSVACTGQRCISLDCTAGWLDCNEDLTDGCEAAATNQNAFKYYLDTDGDGYGTGTALLLCKDVPQYFVGPTAYVRFDGDCDDSNPAIQPGMPDYCDGLDDDCDGTIGEDGLPPAAQLAALKAQACMGVSGVCYTSATLTCGAGGLVCTPGAGSSYEICGNGIDDDCNDGIDANDPDLPAETCNGRDDDCDGNIDAADDWVASDGDVIGAGAGSGGTCNAKGAVGFCQSGTWSCNYAVEICAAATPDIRLAKLGANYDGDCNGQPDELNYIFFAPGAVAGCPSGGSGTAACPFVGLDKINAQLSVAKSGNKQVILASGGYTTSTAIVLVDGVSVRGGYELTNGLWERNGRASIITRDGTTNDTTYEFSNVVIGGNNITRPGTLLEHLELVAADIANDSPLARDAVGLFCYACTGLELNDVAIATGNARSHTKNENEADSFVGSCAKTDGHPGLPGPRQAIFDYAFEGNRPTIWGAKDGPNGLPGGNGTSGCGGPGGNGSHAGGSSIALQLLQSPGVKLQGVTIKSVGKGGKGGTGARGGKKSALGSAEGGGGGGGNGGHSIGIVVDSATAPSIANKGALQFATEFMTNVAEKSEPGLGGDGGSGGEVGMVNSGDAAVVGGAEPVGARGPQGRTGLGLRGYCLDCASKLSYSDAGEAVEPEFNVECRQLGTPASRVSIDPDGWGKAPPFEVVCRNGAALVMANSYVEGSPQNGEFKSTLEFADLTGVGATLFYTDTLNSNVSNTKTVTALGHWMNLGNTLRVDMGSSVDSLVNQAGYPFTLQNEVPGSQFVYPLWLTAERVTLGGVSFGLYQARPTGFSYGKTDNDGWETIACGQSYPGPFWYGDSTNSPAETNCWRGTLWGRRNENLPIWNTEGAASAQQFGAFWVQDVVARKSCDGLNAGTYLMDADFVGAKSNGTDDAPVFIRCNDSNDLTWKGLERLLTLASEIATPAKWVSATHRYLFFYTTALDWQAARAECQLRGGDLVTIDSSDEQSWLDAQFTTRGKGIWWIGLSSPDPSEKPWVWANGAKYDDWNVRFAPSSANRRTCASYRWVNGDWFAEDCATSHPFVCEVP